MKRFLQINFTAILLACFMVVCGINVGLAKENVELNIVSTQADRNIVVYSIPLYEGTCESSAFTILRDTLKERGLLIQSATSIRMYVVNNKMLFSHELIALNSGKNKNPATEYVSIMSNSVEKLDKYVLNLQNKYGYKVDTAYKTELMNGSAIMYIVALSK